MLKTLAHFRALAQANVIFLQVTFAALAVLKCSRRVQQLPEKISSALQILDAAHTYSNERKSFYTALILLLRKLSSFAL